MNIDGHEVERRADRLVYVDDGAAGCCGDDAEYYDDRARAYQKRADELHVIAEFVRREAAEKAASDAATELNRRALLVCNAWHGCEDITASGKAFTDYLPQWRDVVRWIDAERES